MLSNHGRGVSTHHGADQRGGGHYEGGGTFLNFKQVQRGLIEYQFTSVTRVTAWVFDR